MNGWNAAPVREPAGFVTAAVPHPDAAGQAHASSRRARRRSLVICESRHCDAIARVGVKIERDDLVTFVFSLCVDHACIAIRETPRQVRAIGGIRIAMVAIPGTGG